MFLRNPSLHTKQIQAAFQRAGLHNSNGEYPRFISAEPDQLKAHGKILKLENKGIPISEFEAKVTSLEASLNGKIYSIAYGRTNLHTLLYILPRRYVMPTIISLDSSELSRAINWLCVGRTGSGKSYALTVLLGIYAKYLPEVSITVCDYKHSSFAVFADTHNFYGYTDVADGIRVFYKEFTERLAANDEERNKHIRVLLIDEYGAFISSLDKKTADEMRSMIANMLFMSRSLGMRILVGIQRADAEYFKSGARDQFANILALGNLSREQKQMLFTDYKDQMTENCGLGEGYLLLDGKPIERVSVAEIKDMDALNESIRKTMYH